MVIQLRSFDDKEITTTNKNNLSLESHLAASKRKRPSTVAISNFDHRQFVTATDRWLPTFVSGIWNPTDAGKVAGLKPGM